MEDGADELHQPPSGPLQLEARDWRKTQRHLITVGDETYQNGVHCAV